jgi:bacillolysin
LTHRFLDQNRELLLIQNPSAEFALTSTEKDPLGGTVARFQQKWGALEVWPGTLTANISPAGYLTVVTGAYSPSPASITKTPVLSAEEAEARAVLHLGASPGTSAPLTPATLKVFADKGRTPELSYEVLVAHGNRHERVFVSAQTGEILLSLSETCTGAATGSGTDIFGEIRPLNVFAKGTPVRYFLRDTSKPMYSALTGKGVILIKDGATLPATLISSPGLTYGFAPNAVSAAYNFSQIYDFYYTTLKRNSYDNKGGDISCLINSPDEDTGGSLDNAYWDDISREFIFGNTNNYVGASDVIAHEFTHAVTTYSADLVYHYQSGAIDESLSDIMGECFEKQLYGANDWKAGTLLDELLRDFITPEDFDQPSRMSDFDLTLDDDRGVHTNSGIINHAFYLLAEGLPVGGIGLEQARDIFYRTLITKLNKRSNFLDLRLGCVLSAEELYGVGGTQAAKVRAAFDAVEIYESRPAGIPDNLTPPGGPDAYLFIYPAMDGNYYLGRKEAALGDRNNITPISSSPIDPDCRPTLSEGGRSVMFVSPDRSLISALTDGSVSEPTGYYNVNSVAVSADSNYIAMIKRDPGTDLSINEIIYINLATGQTVTISVSGPTSERVSRTKIKSIDQIDLSPDGQNAVFDALTETTLETGEVVSEWSIFTLDLNTKKIVRLTGPYDDYNAGNPTYSRTSSNRIAFEADSSDSTSILAFDLGTDSDSIIYSHSPPTDYWFRPRFSAADNFVVFTNDYLSAATHDYYVHVVKLALRADRLTPSGTPTVLTNFAISGLSYRRGEFAGSPVLSISATTPTLTGGATGSFRITRSSGDKAIRVPFSFITLGTAQSGTDYKRLSTTALLPAGANSIDVPVTCLLPADAAPETLTLSLDPQVHYQIADREAMIELRARDFPQILSQPTDLLAAANTTQVFNVTASGTDLKYQWYFAGKAITGATAKDLSLKVTLKSAGAYTLKVTDSSGDTAQAIVTLRVATLPKITTPPPATLSLALGGSTTLSVTATGEALSYQWFRNGVALDGKTAPSLTLASATADTAGNYTVRVSNIAGGVTTKGTALTVLAPPSVGAISGPATVITGKAFALAVTAAGPGKLSYQWHLNGTPIPKATAATYKVLRATAASAGTYTVTVTNSVGSTLSAPFVLALSP